MTLKAVILWSYLPSTVGKAGNIKHEYHLAARASYISVPLQFRHLPFPSRLDTATAVRATDAAIGTFSGTFYLRSTIKNSAFSSALPPPPPLNRRSAGQRLHRSLDDHRQDGDLQPAAAKPGPQDTPDQVLEAKPRRGDRRRRLRH